LLVELARFASRRPRAELQALAFFDEADRYLPATSKPVTKEPMENLLKRARSAGLGIMLATQSPGDLDYKSKENITTWLVGRVNQPQALRKLLDVLGSRVADSLPQLTVGEFYLKSDSDHATKFKAFLPAIIPRQLEESRIIDLASDQRSTRRASPEQAPLASPVASPAS
jgi:DNA helicase HerA-like ATPase